jgi:hypothetical protein
VLLGRYRCEQRVNVLICWQGLDYAIANGLRCGSPSQLSPQLPNGASNQYKLCEFSVQSAVSIQCRNASRGANVYSLDSHVAARTSENQLARTPSLSAREFRCAQADKTATSKADTAPTCHPHGINNYLAPCLGCDMRGRVLIRRRRALTLTLCVTRTDKTFRPKKAKSKDGLRSSFVANRMRTDCPRIVNIVSSAILRTPPVCCY